MACRMAETRLRHCQWGQAQLPMRRGNINVLSRGRVYWSVLTDWAPPTSVVHLQFYFANFPFMLAPFPIVTSDKFD